MSAEVLDLSRPRRIHLVGVGGAGMSAYAVVLAAMGHQVTGSDLKESASTQRLQAAGVQVMIGHDPSNLGEAELLARSTAVPDQNPEIQAARVKGVPVLDRAELLAAICRLRRVLAVTGTHGKTTTTSMAALALVEAGLRPSFLIGGDLNEVGTNAVWDEGEWLVVEADESDGTFLALDPAIGVVTSVDLDHLDHYGTEEALHAAFAAFVERAGQAVLWAEDPGVARLVDQFAATGEAPPRLLTVGGAGRAAIVVEAVVEPPGPGRLRVAWPDGTTLATVLAVPGAHNLTNAALAAVAARAAGAEPEAIGRALRRFAGVARRFEARGTWRGVRLVDDYGHLPAEIEAALATARQVHPGRLVAVFQPHRYSRTALQAEQLGAALSGADLVVVTDVYAAGERPVPGVNGQLVADAAARRGAVVHYVPERPALAREVAGLLAPGDLCLSLGAGDVTQLADELQALP
ncbi:UDP-N-acetylmuramate--L-alanine ligase [Aciditerrimonas ferrireducens]|jgi:UDP-N-acetylmuramate--alanine ligase|uniref:UDP-N-acetylmuramate--L-alanine ligase n=1 Tax=Aciditerrimonas ferrireducens TaxID=667306 RepID=UPI0020065808|nr:UDP-N-acetylmuramate--L-alanine ligase [Aciditerrimonas ferrireducens]MCK4178204.1 UDP-N-acetylmuramate--L-alanine ligase [Aciditerrimonas ferrireducens]